MIASSNADTRAAAHGVKPAAYVIALACVMLISAEPARAQYSASGFSITPPAPFEIAPVKSPRFDVGVGFNSHTGKPAKAGTSANLCEAGFKFAAANNALTREQINVLMTTPERIKQIRSTIEMLFAISSQTPFTLQGHNGLEFIGTPRMGPGAAEARIFMSMVETQAGRMTMVCSTTAADIDAATHQFRAIRATITMPDKARAAPRSAETPAP